MVKKFGRHGEVIWEDELPQVRSFGKYGENLWESGGQKGEIIWE
jgi:hypothetical protein